VAQLASYSWGVRLAPTTLQASSAASNRGSRQHRYGELWLDRLKELGDVDEVQWLMGQASGEAAGGARENR